MSVHLAKDFRLESPSHGQRGGCGDEDWVEVFKDRVAEDLKAVFQDNMDWSTSLPILNLLNKLQKIEDERGADPLSSPTPTPKMEEQTLDPARSP